MSRSPRARGRFDSSSRSPGDSGVPSPLDEHQTPSAAGVDLGSLRGRGLRGRWLQRFHPKGAHTRVRSSDPSGPTRTPPDPPAPPIGPPQPPSDHY